MRKRYHDQQQDKGLDTETISMESLNCLFVSRRYSSELRLFIALRLMTQRRPTDVIGSFSRLLSRARKAIRTTLLEDWTGAKLCEKLVREYLENNESDHSLFLAVTEKFSQIVGPLERAADALRKAIAAEDTKSETKQRYQTCYQEAVGLIRLSRGLEAGLAEISYVAEHQGQIQVEEDYRAYSLFFQYR
jgi:hypothetical protein